MLQCNESILTKNKIKPKWLRLRRLSMHCNQTLILMRLPLNQERLNIKNFVSLDFCFGFFFLSICPSRYPGRWTGWRRPLAGSYRSALFRPVMVHLVLFITSSTIFRPVHPHPSSFLCMLCSLLHFGGPLRASREFAVKVCGGGERTACGMTFIQCGCYWSLKCCEWKCGQKDRRMGGEMTLTVYGSLISCHWTTWKECFAKEYLYIFIYDAI